MLQKHQHDIYPSCWVKTPQTYQTQTFVKAMFRETSEAVKKYAQPCFSTEFSTRCLTEHAMLYYGRVVSRVTRRMPMLRSNLVKC